MSSGSGYVNALQPKGEGTAKAKVEAKAATAPTRKETHYKMKYDPSRKPENKLNNEVESATDPNPLKKTKETMTCQIEHVFANWTYLNDVIDEKISKVNTGEEFSVFVSYAGCDVPKEAFAKSTRTIATLRDDCCRAFPSLIMQGDVARYFCVSLLSKDTCDGKSDITGEKLKMENGNFIDIQPSEQIEIKFV